MQLLLIFHKTNLKSENFKVLLDLAVFQKLWRKGRGKFILCLSLFLTVHINFQYRFKWHTSLFIISFYLFFFLLLYSFSTHLQFDCFFSLIFDCKFNEYV